MILTLATLLVLAPAADDEKILLDFDGPLDRSRVATWDVRIAPSNSALRVSSSHHEAWPNVTFKAPGGAWDLSPYEYVALDVVNVGPNGVTVHLRIDSGPSDGQENCNTGKVTLDRGARGTLRAPLERRRPVKAGFKFIGMRGSPAGRYRTVDAARITQMMVFLAEPSEDHVFEIDNLRVGGAYAGPLNEPIDPKTFLPFVDRLGQFIHRDWPGKARSDGQLRERAESEAAELERRPGPAQWNRFGGWAGGPSLEATGHFRTGKHAGKWWLVDPEGRLFFSHGVDCVTLRGSSPVEERLAWFRSLPVREDPVFGSFYHPASQVVQGHYQWRKPLCFNFASANLRRKYGDAWKVRAAERAHLRLRSWGMNTIANWSDAGIYLRRRTPYVVAIHFGSAYLQGSEGYWGRFPDVFDPAFRAKLRERLAMEKGTSAGDAWCIGYFVDNELAWGGEVTLAVATLKSPPGQSAKQVFVDDLKRKYGSIEKLNAAWRARHASWDALLAHRGEVDVNAARADLLAFNEKTADRYFRTCRDEVKAVAPKNLYLGCRFAWVNDLAARAASKYCDVVSFNLYQRSIADFKMPGGADVPVLVGEFHFGALDRGPFAAALVKVKDQAERAGLYREYVRGALRHPQFVGCHWFQYRDQPTSGRELDGENYQVGFVDIADTPYPETVAASREVGDLLYRYRLEGK